MINISEIDCCTSAEALILLSALDAYMAKEEDGPGCLMPTAYKLGYEDEG
jgi:hypothetical protein